MAVKEMDYRCWVLDYPAGSGDDGRHFKTSEDAQGRVYPPGEQAIPRQLAAPCHVVICDTAGCGEELESSGEGWTVHLANPADAENEAIAEGWTAEDGVLTCYHCDEDAAYIAEHGNDDLETGHTRDPEGDEAAHA